MKVDTMKHYWLIPLVGLLIWVGAVAARKTDSPGFHSPESHGDVSTESLPDIITMAGELTSRLETLNKEIAGQSDVSTVQSRLSWVAKETRVLSQKVEFYKQKSGYGYDQILDVKARMDQNLAELLELIASTHESINRIQGWEKEWIEEGSRWDHLQSTLSTQVSYHSLDTTFANVHQTIRDSQHLVSQALEPLLSQVQAAEIIRASQASLELELNALASALNDTLMHKTTRSMFSSRYYSLLKQGIYKDLPKRLNRISKPDLQFFQRHGWLLFIQALFSLVLSMGIVQQRHALMKREQWQFIARRPLEAGIFVAAIATSLFHGAVPGPWRLLSQCVVIISLARLVGAVVGNRYPQRAWVIYGLCLYLITTRIFGIFDLPLPLFRLYIFSTALTGIFLCRWRTRTPDQQGDESLYPHAFRLGSLLCLLIVIAEMGGYTALSVLLLESSLKTILIVLAGWLLIVMLRGFLEWMLYSPAVKRIPFLEIKTPVILSRSALLVNLFAATLTGTFILVVWRIYTNPAEAVQAVWSFGVNVGPRRITVGLILIAAALLYGAFILSWAVQAMLMEGLFTKQHLQVGVRMSMARLIHYGFVFMGFLLALVTLGVQLRDFTIVAGALGVGIGFGLQGIINNFVSGLILLFERPIKVGDFIELGPHQAEIKKIGLRATVVQTYDRSEIVVPNSDLISNQVTNLTLSDQYTGMTLPVRVAHGSDVSIVMNTLLASALKNRNLSDHPAPRVLFKGFGESSLDFELRAWIANVDAMCQIKSDIYQEIHRQFQLFNIKMPFPHQDLEINMVNT